jgi:hypothetical protein
VETPEFEVNLFGDISHNPVHAKTAAEAVRIGRKWLSHIDAVIKRMPTEDRSPYPPEETETAAMPARKAPLQVPPQVNPKPSFSDLPPWEDMGEDDDTNDTYDNEKR